MNEHPHRSATTAWDGRPVCPICDRAYDPLRLVLKLEDVHRHPAEPCMSCRQKARIAKMKKERGW